MSKDRNTVEGGFQPVTEGYQPMQKGYQPRASGSSDGTAPKPPTGGSSAMLPQSGQPQSSGKK